MWCRSGGCRRSRPRISGPSPAFRERHLAAFANVFLQALELCRAAGMVKLGKVALDGTKVRANASRHKAMSYARLTEKQKVLAREVSDLLAEAKTVDASEDAKFGPGKRGDELPVELANRQARSRAMAIARASIEEEALGQGAGGGRGEGGRARGRR